MWSFSIPKTRRLSSKFRLLLGDKLIGLAVCPDHRCVTGTKTAAFEKKCVLVDTAPKTTWSLKMTTGKRRNIYIYTIPNNTNCWIQLIRWILKMTIFERRYFLKTIIFRIYVGFRECTSRRQGSLYPMVLLDPFMVYLPTFGWLVW